jgi:hypothetical protein
MTNPTNGEQPPLLMEKKCVGSKLTCSDGESISYTNLTFNGHHQKNK